MPAREDASTPEERAVIDRFFTNSDQPIFAIRGLPDIVKGALFARYSRSNKPLRRLFLDEFARPGDGEGADASSAGAIDRAAGLYQRIFVEYGDDSVAQLVGAHVAVEGASNILTKVLEWGRLMSYMEQSTRYIPYTDRPNGHWRYHIPAELGDHPALEREYVATLDGIFELYAGLFEPLQDRLRERFPNEAGDLPRIYNNSIRAKTCDILRGLLPAATTASVGLYGSAQAFESLLLRLQGHPLAEARTTGIALLAELRKVVPALFDRVDDPARGTAWSAYLHANAVNSAAAVAALTPPPPRTSDPVTLTDFDPEGETKVAAAILFGATDLPDAQALDFARTLPDATLDRLFDEYSGDRANRRHRPGRAFERTDYRFDVVSDYGAFRDLQRHRLLTIDWQPLSPDLGYVVPREIEEFGWTDHWHTAIESGRRLHASLTAGGLEPIAPYVLSMAHRIRYVMQMNAREAMHLIELRTSAQAHPGYRSVAEEMHHLIRDVAGHRRIASAMRFVGESAADLERLQAERRSEQKRLAAANAVPAPQSPADTTPNGR